MFMTISVSCHALLLPLWMHINTEFLCSHDENPARFLLLTFCSIYFHTSRAFKDFFSLSQGGLAAYAAFRILDDLINPDQVLFIILFLLYDLSIITQWSYDLSWLCFILLNLCQAGSPAVNQAYAVRKQIKWCTQLPQILLSTPMSYLRFFLTFTNFDDLPLILTNTHCEKFRINWICSAIAWLISPNVF